MTQCSEHSARLARLRFQMDRRINFGLQLERGCHRQDAAAAWLSRNFLFDFQNTRFVALHRTQRQVAARLTASVSSRRKRFARSRVSAIEAMVLAPVEVSRQQNLTFSCPTLTQTLSRLAREGLQAVQAWTQNSNLTLPDPPKLANLKPPVTLHYAHYNFVRIHRTLRCTPAMAAGASDRLWWVEALLSET